MTKMKQELINDVLTGLLVAATFAAVVPADALAQLANAVDQSAVNVAKPALKVAAIISYCLGTVLTITGISGAKKHADAPAQTPLGPAIGKLSAGAAFLTAPTVVGMLQQTGSTTITGTSSFSTISGF